MNSNNNQPEPASELPPLAWPEFTDDKARLDWWRSCVQAYLALWDSPASFTPVTPKESDALELRLSCAIPPLLRTYHEQIGTLNLAETLCSVTPAKCSSIESLHDGYPGITDILEDAPDARQQWALVNQLIVFGDYLGNGNLWCFHRETGEVWYFDHDCSPMLTQIFTDVGQYLDILMFKCLLEAHGEEENEDLLRERLGDAVVEKWMY
ncbi:SMI1/KNR4 family protein [Erwiniaceae bacterium BAC15a-03b]|uniref:SMI1/KNR4 family protein n=1 Tax=Winslowiella arboricola TaxID=2978220 RepID=A0A9J6PNL6_9GAMM|nr:SMI1/KNR4 family protein [Winslowiella arboricola]MCU5773980.1 SMI1/KNR4 family protein [Winslowiella arboricola]MCU5777293.1 SMI1/KNR4 family protein [Winslowiella arboricola]